MSGGGDDWTRRFDEADGVLNWFREPDHPGAATPRGDGARPEIPGGPDASEEATAADRAPREAGRPPAATPNARRAGVVCVANQKGGVGKTTTAVSVAAALAEAGAEVLVVDLDPQGNATTGLGLRVHEGDPSTYTVVVEEADAESAIEPTGVPRLYCLPSSLDLAGAEIELVPAFSREQRLSRAVEKIRGDFDVVIVDCPPALGLLTVNALVACDQVLLPIQCEYYALEGVGQLTRSLDLVRRGLNPDLEIGGVVLTMYDARTRLSAQVAGEVRDHFGDLVFRTVIPRTVRLSEAPGFGQPITSFDPSSRGARAYLRLADEVAGRLGLGVERLSAFEAITGEQHDESPAAPRPAADPGGDAEWSANYVEPAAGSTDSIDAHEHKDRP